MNYNKLLTEWRSFLKENVGTRTKENYLEGYCHVFALALEELRPELNIGYIIGQLDDINSEEEGDYIDIVVHVFCMDDNEMVYDANGINTLSHLENSDFMQTFGDTEINFVEEGEEARQVLQDFSGMDEQDSYNRDMLKPFTQQDIDEAKAYIQKNHPDMLTA